MSTEFAIKRGYINGNKIFIATYKDKNYQEKELDSLSKQILDVEDTNGGGGIFNSEASVSLKYGTEIKPFTFTAMDLYADTPDDLKTKILSRFQAIMQWKNQMNAHEEFTLIF